MLSDQQKRVISKLKYDITRLKLGVNTVITPKRGDIEINSELLTTPILRSIVTICDKENLSYCASA
jgi:hypothetical protein